MWLLMLPPPIPTSLIELVERDFLHSALGDLLINKIPILLLFHHSFAVHLLN